MLGRPYSGCVELIFNKGHQVATIRGDRIQSANISSG